MKLLLLPALLSMSVVACAPASQGPEAESARSAGVNAATSPASASRQPLAAPPQASASAADEESAEEAAKAAEVDARIDKILGDHNAYRRALERLQQAVAGDDRSGVAALVRYPLEARSRHGKLHIENAQAFVAHYEDILAPAVVQTIADQRYADLFVSQKGVMLGSGEVWINGVCHDPRCVDVDVKVVTFQQGG